MEPATPFATGEKVYNERKERKSFGTVTSILNCNAKKKPQYYNVQYKNLQCLRKWEKMYNSICIR